ncbi:MAG TPA: DUF5693 family protein [Candidatus Wallbacteria bacterium]|nr:DUF5693 family protein [Candidatus Wallbacteria bacterium]
MFSKRNSIFLLVIFLALFLSLIVSVKRIILENNNNNVEIGIDYAKFEQICFSEGSDIFSGFQILLKSGINSAIVREDTLATLAAAGHVSLFNGNDLLRNFRSSALINPLLARFIQKKSIQPHYTYIITSETKIHDRVFNELKIKLKDDDQKISVNTENLAGEGESEKAPFHLITITSSAPEIYNVGVGFAPETLTLLEKLNFSVILGLSDSSFLTASQIDRLIEKLQNIKSLSGVFIEGPVVPGFSEKDTQNIEYFGKKLSELCRNKSKFILMEFENAIGIAQITPFLKEMTVRGHRLSSVEKKTPSTLEEHNQVIERYLRAVRERNVRLVVVEGLTSKLRGVPMNLLMQNFNFLDTLVNKIKNAGFNIKSSSAFETDLASPIFIIIISWGILATYILLGEYIFGMPRKISYLILTIFMAFILIFALKWYGTGAMTVYRQVLALLAAFIMPLAPVIYKVRPDKLLPKTYDFYIVFYRAVFLLLYNMFFVVLFSTFVTGLLSSVEFINGIEFFRGVKAALLVPVFLAVLLVMRSESLFAKAAEFMKMSVRVYQALIFVVAALFLWFYAPDIGSVLSVDYHAAGGYDAYLNFFFERITGVELYFKEYAIGYPMLLLYFYLSLRKMNKFNIVLAAIGTLASISVFNSFCHVHVPLLITASRAFYGLLAGIVIGAAFCSIAEFLLTFYKETGQGESQ